MKYQLNNEKILFTQLGEEGIIYDNEKNSYISLNETLFKILKCIVDDLETEQIVKKLCDEYAISEDDCRREVENALTKLIEKDYLIK